MRVLLESLRIGSSWMLLASSLCDSIGAVILGLG